MMKSLLAFLLSVALPLQFSVAEEAPARKAQPTKTSSSKPTGKVAPKTSSWQSAMMTSLKAIDANSTAGAIGVYMKNLKTGKEISFRGDEFWYIASGVKLPVALEVMRQIDAGQLSMDTKVEVQESDFVDGAGELNYIKPESKVSIRLLLDQTLTFSDNTAADILIRTAGLEKINALTSSLVPEGFTPITTLAEVRRQAYSAFHPDAIVLSNTDFMKLKTIKEEQAKLDHLAKLLKLKRTDFKQQTLDGAFEAYYSELLNSATLRGYGLLLEKLMHGEILSFDSRRKLLDLMERAETGENRIKAGLPKNAIFAHKTGTQHKRFCDMGILSNGSAGSDEYVVVACLRKLPVEEADKIFRKIGQAIQDSGALGKAKK